MRRRLLLAAGLCAAAAAVVWAVAFHVAAVQQADIRLWEHVLWRGGPRSAHAASDLLSLFDPARGALLTAALVAGAVVAGRRRLAVLAGIVAAGSGLSAHFLKIALAGQRDFPLGHSARGSSPGAGIP